MYINITNHTNTCILLSYVHEVSIYTEQRLMLFSVIWFIFWTYLYPCRLSYFLWGSHNRHTYILGIDFRIDYIVLYYIGIDYSNVGKKELRDKEEIMINSWYQKNHTLISFIQMIAHVQNKQHHGLAQNDNVVSFAVEIYSFSANWCLLIY